jgi:hypothetical protein
MTGIYKPQQAMAIGHVPAAARVDIYEYLSVNYLETLNKELPYVPGGKPLVDRVALILEHYARAAENVSQFRLAQTWRVIAYAMNLLLRRRAEYHLERRMERLRRISPGFKKDATTAQLFVSFDNPDDEGQTSAKALPAISMDRSNPMRSLLSEEIESTSNVPTPLASPARDSMDGRQDHVPISGGKMASVLEPETLTLPPAVHPPRFETRRRLDSVPLSIYSQDSENTQITQASTDGYDFYDMEAVARAVDVPLPKRKDVLTLDYVDSISPTSRRKQLSRYDSDESFGQMFSISDGSRKTTGLTGSSYGSLPKRTTKMTRALEHLSEADSDIGDDAYQSHIHGKKFEEFSGHLKQPPIRRAFQRTETDITNITNITDEHHLITQTTSDSFGSREPYLAQPSLSLNGEPQQEDQGANLMDSPRIDDETSPYIIEADYLHWPEDPPYPYLSTSDTAASTSMAPPLQPCSVVSRALSFEVRSSALNASAMILLLDNLVPDDIIDHFQASAVLRQHHSRLMNMRLFVEAAHLRKLCIKGWPGEILADWGCDYSSIYAPAQRGVHAGFLCPTCRKPIEPDRASPSNDSIWRCERCRAVMAPCAVCGHRDTSPNLPPLPLSNELAPRCPSDDEEEILSTWCYCPTCGHGGHSTCMQGWHSSFDATPYHRDRTEAMAEPDAHANYSEGCCPFDGCGHACLSGRWRTESAASRFEEVSRAVREASRTPTGLSPNHGAADSAGNKVADLGIYGDANEVVQSRAVESVRETLGGAASSSRVSSSSILSSSPGKNALPEGRVSGERGRERRKSVKFVGSDDRK